MTISENAKKTAQWWTSQLRSSIVKMDNGTDQSGLYELLSVMIVKDDKYSEDQLKRFEDGLAARIAIDVAECIDCFVAVDYGPDDTLLEVAESVGIELGNMDLPWKTWTRTSKEKVVLSHGYAAPQVEI